MKKNTIISVLTLAVAGIAVMTGCKDKREPGRVYMPDMAYSRAVETYSLLDSNKYTTDPADMGHKIFYNSKPVLGTLERGQLAAYTLPNDSNGYKLSAQVINPLTPLTSKDSAEASRLFNINCAICHGADGKATGPLAVSGKIGGVANLTGDAYIKMADGTMYHSIYYGKNNMGSYASQLDRKQRWMLVQYIRTLQPKQAAAVAAPAVAATTDSSTKAKAKS